MITTLALLLNANAADLSAAETSFIGASMLEGNVDVWFDPANVSALEDSETSYAYFNGNSLYIGAEDNDGNTFSTILCPRRAQTPFLPVPKGPKHLSLDQRALGLGWSGGSQY